MQMVFPIILGLLLLGSFIACYFSSKYWHWAHVLLTETVFLLGLAFLILAGEVVRIQKFYGAQNQANLKQIERLEPQVLALKFGTEDGGVISQLENAEIPVQTTGDGEDEPSRMLSVGDLEHQLGMVNRLRGRAWRDVELGQIVDPEKLIISLRVPAPNPHGIDQDLIVYVFEQGDAGPASERGKQYIGEFRVVNVADDQIQLQPASRFDQRSRDRLGQTQAPWILYENMPIDEHPDGRLEIFTGTTPEELQRMLPAESIEEYVRHGGPAQPGDDEWHRTGYDENGALVKPDDWNASTQFKYRRALRDYNSIFQELAKRFTQMQADIAKLTQGNQQLAGTLASAKKLQQMGEAYQAKLQNDLAGATRDRQAIDAHKNQVETQLANARALLDDLVNQNAAMGNSMQ